MASMNTDGDELLRKAEAKKILFLARKVLSALGHGFRGKPFFHRLQASFCSFAFLIFSAFATIGPITEANPDWAKDVIWYQIFPERFANGDPDNDPTRESTGYPQFLPESWAVMDWTADWYGRADWEKEKSPHFYKTVYHRRYGGDLQGVIDRLDYLQDLGITGIYFNPIFYGESLHKYDGSSFHHIDPYFGPDPEGDLRLMEGETEDPATWNATAADRLFLELLCEAKARDIRVIIDGVWNHTGRGFFGFEDLLENQERSRYADWFKVIRFDDPGTGRYEFDYHGWWGHKSLPEFARSEDGRNLATGPKEYIFHATRRWMDPDGDGDPSDGVDGWRLDVAEEVPVGFWSDWHGLVRSINPEAFTTAEIWKPSAEFIREAGFDSAMNYNGFAIPVKGWLIDGSISAGEFAKLLRNSRETHLDDTPLLLQNLVDSHDTQRVGSMVANRDSFYRYLSADQFDYDNNDRVSAMVPRYNLNTPGDDGRRIWKMIALFQATYVGAPMIYYGTEAGMIGADDPDDRMPMWWPELDFEMQSVMPDGSERTEAQSIGFDREIFESYRDAFRLRNSEPAFRRGAFRALGTDDQAQVFAFERSLDGSRLLVLINRGDKSFPLKSPLFTKAELLHATDPNADATTLPPLSAAVFRLP